MGMALAVAVAGTLASAPIASAYDAFVTIPSAGYTTTTSDAKMGAIAGTMKIDTWSFGVTSNATPTALDRNIKPSFGTFTFSKAVDENSSRIYLDDLPNAKQLKDVIVTVRHAGEPKPTFLKYCFRDVKFNLYRTAGAPGGGSWPTEEVGFVYRTMTTSFTPQDRSTGGMLTPIKRGWDVVGRVLVGSTILASC